MQRSKIWIILLTVSIADAGTRASSKSPTSENIKSATRYVRYHRSIIPGFSCKSNAETTSAGSRSIAQRDVPASTPKKTFLYGFSGTRNSQFRAVSCAIGFPIFRKKSTKNKIQPGTRNPDTSMILTQNREIPTLTSR